MLDILAVSPHPDDVELCCGGLIVKLSTEKHEVGIVDLTKGELGTEGTGETRMREARAAADILGIKVRDNIDLGDCRVGYSFKEAQKLAGVIRQHQPSLVLAPYGDNHHPDHAASRKLTDKAVFLAGLPKVHTGHRAHHVGMVAYYMLHQSFNPSFIVDVTKNYVKKLEAIKAYKSQMGLMLGIEGLLRSVELRDQTFGSRIGVERGEPFFVMTPLKIDDPVVLSK
jgi:bacillithiol biosynthesis deacetylase BshB1